MLDIDSQAFRSDPQGAYREMRRSDIAARSRRGCELLTYGAIDPILRDRNLYWPLLKVLELNGISGGPMYEHRRRSLVNLRGDEHARMRRLAMLGFSRRIIETKREMIRCLVEDLLDEVSGRATFDFNSEIAHKLPSMMFCLLIGAPVSDAPLISRLSLSLNSNILKMAPGSGDQIEAAHGELADYVTGQISRRRSIPGDDLLSALVALESDDDRLSSEELVALTINILQASTDSTSNQMSLTVGSLCDHPDEWASLVNDPALASGAVEEGLRYSPRQLATLRMGDRDVVIDDVVVPARTMLVLCVASANRDPAVFADPDRFDIRRVHPRPQLSFGAGVHNCIGSGVAKMEMEELLTGMAKRFRGIKRVEQPQVSTAGAHAVEVERLLIDVAV